MAARYGASIVKKGLVINCDAGNPKSYPGSGLNWYNLAASTFDTSNTAIGTLSNSSNVTFSSAQGGSLVLDGTIASYIDYGVGADIFNPTSVWDNPHELSLEIWYKSSGLGSGQTLGGLIAWTYGIRCYINSSSNLYYCFDNGSDLSTQYTYGSMFDGNWHQVVIGTKNAGSSGYVDGVLRASNTRRWQGRTRWSTNNLRLGRDNNNTTYNLDGNIAIFRMYKKFLNEKEVSQNFHALRGRFGV